MTGLISKPTVATELGVLVNNEQTKLTAAAVNTIATSTVTASIITPIVAIFFQDNLTWGGSVGAILIATLGAFVAYYLHTKARAILIQLEIGK